MKYIIYTKLLQKKNHKMLNEITNKYILFCFKIELQFIF